MRWRPPTSCPIGRGNGSHVATLQTYPPMPEIGHPEAYYAHLAKRADRRNDPHAREAAKVGQYITLALSGDLEWDQQVRYFKHAINRHCHPPDFCNDGCWKFYHDLADVVREHCGTEALRRAMAEDDAFARRLSIGQLREKIVPDARHFFFKLMGGESGCPLWFASEDWEQLRLVRDQWL